MDKDLAIGIFLACLAGLFVLWVVKITYESKQGVSREAAAKLEAEKKEYLAWANLPTMDDIAEWDSLKIKTQEGWAVYPKPIWTG